MVSCAWREPRSNRLYGPGKRRRRTSQPLPSPCLSIITTIFGSAQVMRCFASTRLCLMARPDLRQPGYWKGPSSPCLKIRGEESGSAPQVVEELLLTVTNGRHIAWKADGRRARWRVLPKARVTGPYGPAALPDSSTACKENSLCPPQSLRN